MKVTRGNDVESKIHFIPLKLWARGGLFIGEIKCHITISHCPEPTIPLAEYHRRDTFAPQGLRSLHPASAAASGQNSVFQKNKSPIPGSCLGVTSGEGHSGAPPARIIARWSLRPSRRQGSWARESCTKPLTQWGHGHFGLPSWDLQLAPTNSNTFQL
jgi:hypothetical protein